MELVVTFNEMGHACMILDPDTEWETPDEVDFILLEAADGLKYFGITVDEEARSLWFDPVLWNMKQATYMAELEEYCALVEDENNEPRENGYYLYVSSLGATGDDRLIDDLGSFVWSVLDAIQYIMGVIKNAEQGTD